MSFIKNLNWRYATKKFDPERKVSPEDLATVLEAIRLAPTSFGLQLMKVYVIANTPANAEKLQKIQAAGWNQPQFTTCSHLIIFTARNDFAQGIEDFFSTVAPSSDIREQITGYEKFVKDYIPNMNQKWSEKQTYIPLGFAMAALAELQIDSCPMEGFDTKAVAEILELPENQSVTLALPIGYRSADDKVHHKLRLTKDKLIIEM